ncbi:hypothetical protein HFN89_05700 [Rhizobium laguerreae]|nr:hypothetical protein [Rhizobium laguerreae]
MELLFSVIMSFCLLMAILTTYMLHEGTTEWYIPVGFLLLYLHPVGIVVFQWVRGKLKKKPVGNN